ncbi:3-isopropylmalate dehydratase, small subunit [Xenorhabdus vietnamensis]|uniref:3-isopropylmalate dehydratase small subunit n=1 Tax=Xenorhabdus vietnamensis TaxID=351656 RepID=A0A1Y2S7D3_9GAMM|nr:3-isopropylmalate dehydratase small subunit [Xenorhabdus vietnamensis]OTA14574.1 3-isopropylmalate dehydratase, small subunit [Xenorhabdus vietnamensis]
MKVYHHGLLVPLDKNNVDTDQIIPKQFLTSTSRDGFGKALFYDWRYLDDDREDPDFVLNASCYQGASILLVRDNFGCGSSREHAPWALKQYGFTVILAESFADIFFNNCMNNKILAITLPERTIDSLFKLAGQYVDIKIEVDLVGQKLLSDKFSPINFDIRPDIKQKLLSGLDSISITETYEVKIKEFEDNLVKTKSWM